MKTRIYPILAFALLLASCTNELDREIIKDDAAPAGPVREFVVKAEMPAVVAAPALTKTVLNGDYSVSWSDGDKISLFAGAANNQFTLDHINGDGSAVFTGSAEGTEFYALYPYDADATIADGVITTSLPCDQTGIAGTFAPGLNKSVAHTDGAQLAMKNVFGLIQFTLTRADITSVTISSAGKEFLTGDVTITLDGSGIPSCSVVNGSRYVTVRPEGDAFAAGTYYAVVVPGTYAGGLTMTFTTATQAAVRKKAADATVQRSKILAAGTPDSALSLSDIIVLGAGETANCYVAGAAGRRYKMPVTAMGNGYTLAPDAGAPTSNGKALGLAASALAPASAQLLWQTSANLINDVIYENGHVLFTLNGSASTPLTPGNASIAVYSDPNCTGDLLWSWHIWVTDVNLESKLQTWSEHPDYSDYSNYVTPQLMDRNLGATDNRPWGVTGNHAANGLLYQWGRKDPFIGADDSAIESTTPMKTYDAANAEIAVVTTSAQSSAVEWGILPVLQHPEYDKNTNTDVYPSPTLTAKFPMRFTKVGNGMWVRPNQCDLWGLPNYAANTNKIGHKTIYDPCPPGYRVMNPYAMSNVLPASNVGGKFADHGTGNITNAETYATDGGYSVKYDGVNTTWLPLNGSYKNDTGALFRVGSYGYIWTCKAGNNHNGVNCYFDSASFYSVNNAGTRSGFGHAVRCQKVD